MNQDKKIYMNKPYFDALTTESKFIQINPECSHSTWGEIIDAWPAGLKVRISRVCRHPHYGGYTPTVGEVHFFPWHNFRYIYVNEDIARGKQ